MRKITSLFLLFTVLVAGAQQKTENIIIITTDGFRWQEVFRGMDTAIANNSKYNQGDSGYIYKKYWSNDENERRKKIFPFLWSTVVNNGQIFGNRNTGSKVDNANPYWFSYPGYNEIFTGYPDTAINKNSYPANPHVTVLEFLNKQVKLKGKVAAFGAWDAFDRILNEERSGIPVVSAFNAAGGKTPNANERLINAMNKDAHRPFGEAECLDVFTHYAAMEYLKTKKPRVLYIAYGETDEWAHAGQYRSYLDAGHQVDAWLKQLWDFVQKDPQYKNKTTLFVTVDHGRGDIKKEEWTGHNNKIEDSHEIWFAVMGPDTPVRGELNTAMQLYQQQFAQTIAKLMGYTYVANHPIADAILYVFKMRK
ncbi:MAG TPA: alkaline phosphatase family protein [Chitinophagaceae bacterium]|nr:alkaline phosphatase family protein [Chitinophagaceae bacterium]